MMPEGSGAGYLPWILPSALASLLCLLVARVICNRRRLPIVRAFFWFLACVFIWVFARFLITLSDDDGLRLLISKFQYIGIAFTPLAWLVFSLTAIRATRYLTHRTLLLLAIVPFITVLLALSNDYHHLIWTQIRFTRFRVMAEHGPWFAVHIAYSYLLIGVATLSAFIEYLRNPRYKRELIAIVLAPLLVLFANFSRLIGWFDTGDLDLVSIAFFVAILLFAWVVVSDNYLQLAPTARTLLVENMQDSLLVVNDEYCVVDANPSAEQLFGIDREGLIGQPLSMLVPGDGVRDRLLDNSFTELTLQGRPFQALNTRISFGTGRVHGYLIVLRDIAELKKVQDQLQRITRELQQANRELQVLANTDCLTRLSNRRHFFEQFSRELARLERTGGELCLLLIDLDHFKRINDTHGHSAGDAVLQRVSAVLGATARKCDIAGRLGGEEFGLLFPDTGIDGARHFAERLREAIQNSHGGGDVPVTASMGLTAAGDDLDVQRIFDRADTALYLSKEAGRNRISVC